MVSAALLIIGNEILSGRTQDKNLAHLAGKLNDAGIQLSECRVVRDEQTAIIAAVNALRGAYDYVFTTGGIGPTHDDITSEAIAAALCRKFTLHPEAERILLEHYGEDINEARMSMAYMPEGASLIANPVSAAPGYYVENVFVMAGVPSIMQAMLENILPLLKGGRPMLSRMVTTDFTEGQIATELEALQERHPNVEIGSYPFFKDGKLGVNLVVRGFDEISVEAAYNALTLWLGRLETRRNA